MKELRIGFIGINSVLLNGDENVKIFEDSKKFIKELVKPNQLMVFEEVFVDNLQSQGKLANLIDEWGELSFDLIIIQSVGFGLGIGPVDLAMSQKNVPIVIWALPEPGLAEGVALKRNSWCGANMHTAHLNKLGVKYEYIYGMPGKDVEFDLKKIIKVFEVMKRLRNSTIGAIGGRVPGYYDSNFDELSLRKSLGIKFEFFDLAQVFALFDKITEKEVSDTASEIYSKKRVDIEDYLTNSVKLYIAIKKIVAEYGLSALSVKCLSVMQNICDIAACSPIIALGDVGIPSSCEGDMLGAASMLIMNYFNGDVTTLMDIVGFEFENNNFLIFHCGACPTKMASDSKSIEYRKQSISDTHPGITSEFALKAGKCGLLRLREDNDIRGKYKMLFIEGEGIKGPNLIRGNSLKIKINGDVTKMVEIIIKEGFEHHHAFGYGIRKDLLLKFCEWNNIDTLFM